MSVNQDCIHSIEELQRFKLYACGICDLQFSNANQLDYHLYVNHYPEVTAFRCCHCPKIFADEKSFDSHFQAEHKTQQCSCSFCSAPYENFRNYLKTFNNKRYMCPYCPKYFYRWKRLSVHMTIHEKPMRCKICGKKFSSRRLMRRHLVFNHPEEECDWLPSHCSTSKKSRRSEDKENLKSPSVHMTIHEKLKRCKVCRKKFRSRRLMRRHLIFEHPEEECDWLPSRCSTSKKSRRSGNKENLKSPSVHMTIHEKLKRCKVCRKKFRSRRLMRRHLIFEHPEEERDWLPNRCSSRSSGDKENLMREGNKQN